MDSPISETSTVFDSGPLPTSHSKEYRPSPSMSTEQPLVPPATYHYRYEGWGSTVHIWNVPLDTSASKKNSFWADGDSPTCNPFATLLRSLGGYSEGGEFSGGDIDGLGAKDLFATPPSHFIRRTGWRWYALSEGPPDQSESDDDKRVIDFQTESWWGATSVYNKTDDPSRHGVMFQATWFSIQRTLDDFDGVRYSCKTSWCSGNITLTRLSDDVVIARLILPRFRFDWRLLGMLQVVEPVSQDLLHLILSAIYIKYIVDRERRRNSNHHHRRLEE